MPLRICQAINIHLINSKYQFGFTFIRLGMRNFREPPKWQSPFNFYSLKSRDINCRALLNCMHHLNQADRTNVDDSFTFEVGLNLGIFKMKVYFDFAWYSLSNCFPTNIDISPRGFFFYHHFRNKSSNVFSCVYILQYHFIWTIRKTQGLKSI